MARIVTLFLFVSLSSSLSLAINPEDNIQNNDREVTDTSTQNASSSISSMWDHMTNSTSENTLANKMKSLFNPNLMNKLHKIFSKAEADSTELNNTTTNNGSSPATSLTSEHEESPGHQIDELINYVNYLLAKVHQMDTTMNSTMMNLTDQVAAMGSEVKNLQNELNNIKTLNQSHETIVDEVDDLASLLRYAHASKTSAEGIIVGTGTGVFKIDLNSLKQTEIFTGDAPSVSFDWNTKKVYWVHKGFGIKRAELDGTDVEPLVQDKSASAVAVDSITGNLYYRRSSSESSETIQVCSMDARNCSVVAKAESDFSHIALYPSKGIMFWSTPKATMRANMDGTNASVLISERMVGIGVDEDSDRIYLGASLDGNYIGSTDLNGQDRKVLRGLGESIASIAVHGKTVYFADLHNRMVKSVHKDGGNVTVIAKVTGLLPDVVLYGRTSRPQYNPCEKSECSHLCVLKLDTFACFCPEGKTLDRDGTSCG